jgi:hypothetical protein
MFKLMRVDRNRRRVKQVSQQYEYVWLNVSDSI